MEKVENIYCSINLYEIQGSLDFLAFYYKQDIPVHFAEVMSDYTHPLKLIWPSSNIKPIAFQHKVTCAHIFILCLQSSQCNMISVLFKTM